MKRRRSFFSLFLSDNAENLSVCFGLTAGFVVLCILGLPLFRGQIYMNDDLCAYHLPMRYFYAQSLASGDNFTWLPNVLCGFYLHGDGAVGMYHPLHLLLYGTLPFGAAFNLELLFNYPFMLAGMFLFLRRWQIPRDASLFGALVFAFSGFNLLHYMHLNAVSVAAYIPWLLLSIDVALRETDQRKVAIGRLGVGLFTALQLLLGHPQVFWFSSFVELLYALLLVASWRCWRRFLALGVAKIFGVLAGGIQLIPTWDAFSISVRQGSSWSHFWPTLSPVHFIQLVAPYSFNYLFFRGIPYELKIYDGAIPLILLSLLTVRWKELGPLRKLATGSIVLAAVSLLLCLGPYGYLYRLQALLPIVGRLRAPCRYILLFHLAVAVGASVAYADLSRIVRHGAQLAWGKLWPPGLLLLGSILPPIFWIYAKAGHNMALTKYFASGITSESLIFAGPLLLVLACIVIVMATRGKRWAFVAMIVFTVIDQGFYGLTYVWDTEPGTKVKDFMDFAPTPPDASLYRVQSKSNVWIMKGVRISDGYVCIPPKQRLDSMNKARLRVAGVHWIWDKYDQNSYLLSGKIYGTEAPMPLPRVRLVTRALVSSHPKEDIDTIDVESTALVSEEIKLPEGEAGTAVIMSDQPGKIKVRTNADSKQLLILSESYHKGWHARVDGKESAVVRVYGDFMGCVVNAGEHEVEFMFQPVSLRAGTWLSTVGLGLIAAFFLLSLSSEKRRASVRHSIPE